MYYITINVQYVRYSTGRKIKYFIVLSFYRKYATLRTYTICWISGPTAYVTNCECNLRTQSFFCNLRICHLRTQCFAGLIKASAYPQTHQIFLQYIDLKRSKSNVNLKNKTAEFKVVLRWKSRKGAKLYILCVL
jgi:hypothetical protein